MEAQPDTLRVDTGRAALAEPCTRPLPCRVLLRAAARCATGCGRAHLLIDLEVATAHSEFAGALGGAKALKDVSHCTRQ